VSDDEVIKSCELATVPARPLPVEFDGTTGLMPAILGQYPRIRFDTILPSDIAQVLVGLVRLQEPQQSHEAFRGHFWRPVEFLGALMPRGQVRT